MTRTIPLTQLNTQEFRLRQPLAVDVVNDEGAFVASLQGSKDWQGRGETFDLAIADLADNLVGAAHAGNAEVMALLVRHDDPELEQVMSPPPAPASQNAKSSTKGQMFVLLDAQGAVRAVTDNSEWADRWKRWTGGGYEQFEMNVLP